MVRRKATYLALLLLAAAMAGCDPYRFRVQTKEPVQCRIFSDHNSVTSHLYGFDMHPDAVIQVTSVAWTQYDFAAYCTLSGGDGFQLMLRPALEESVVDSGLVLTFTPKGGVTLDSAGHRLEANPAVHFPIGEPTYVKIYNEESYLQVTVGCDTVLKRYSKRKSSDDIALRTFAGSELKVVDPEWKQIRFVKNSEPEAEEIKQ